MYGKLSKNLPIHRVFLVIAPAYNEEKTIIDNVNSMLALEYPVFEVIIVNDGSTDKTLEKITEYYELIEVPYAYIERIKTQTVQKASEVYKSEIQPPSSLSIKRTEERKRTLPTQVSTPLPILILSVQMWTVFWRSMHCIVVFHRSYLLTNK